MEQDCEYFGKDDCCDNHYNCCDCGGLDCGCGYCFSCNSCEVCNPTSTN